MNELEKAILDGALYAEDLYDKMTDGCWLSHAPESFLQNILAWQIFKKTEHVVYVDASIRKLQYDLDQPRRGRPPIYFGRRPDICVWYKSENRIKAFVEIKLATDRFGPVNRDANKVMRFVKHRHAAYGYLLIYSEADGEKGEVKLSNRFRTWAAELGPRWMLIDPRVSSAEKVASGFGLFRFAP
jgi:hypothetical protein